MNTAITMVSDNAKVGKIPITVTAKSSCPPSCPFNNGGGCYASMGPANLHWTKVSNGERGLSFDKFAEKIKQLPDGQLFRHNVSGDLYGDGEKIDGKALRMLVNANKNKRGFTYTHKHKTKKNLAMIAKANRDGFTINLSANSMSHAVKLLGNGSPVVCVLPIEYQRKYKQVGGEWLESEKEYRERLKGMKTVLDNGVRMVVCPATFRDKVTCETCQICRQSNRNYVIGFPSHGGYKKKVDELIKTFDKTEVSI